MNLNLSNATERFVESDDHDSISVKTIKKTNKLLIAILSFILALVSVAILYIRIGIIIEISVLYGSLFLALTLALILFTYLFTIKKTLKTNNKNYLWIMVAVMVIFLIQIIFKDKIVEIWRDMFRTICNPCLLPNDLN